MSTNVLAKEFERLAQRNAQLLHTEEGDGKSIAESSEKEAEFDSNLTRLEELKGLLEKANRFEEINAWGSTPERKAAVFASDAPTPDPKTTKPVTPGRELLDSAEFKSFLSKVAPNGQISDGSSVYSPKFELKAAILGSDVAGAGAFFRTEYDNHYVPYVQPTLTVRDLVLNTTTDADLISYTRAVAHTNAAAETAEATTAADPAITTTGTSPGPYTTTQAASSGLKPEGTFTWVIVTTQVQAIAEGVPITRRALLNGGQVRSVVDDQLRYDIAARINAQMIAGNGTDPNLRGIRNTTGILTQAFSANIIETLRKGKTKVSDPSTGSGKIPNAAVLNPVDMEKLDLFRVGGSVATDGPFLLNPYGDRPQRIWGMTLVEEPGMTAAKAVVGFFRDAVLWDRQQTTVQVYDQHKDFAARNLLYMLAEWWGAFGVYQPKSFCDCSTV